MATGPIPIQVLVIDDDEAGAAAVEGALRRAGMDAAVRRVDTAAAIRNAMDAQGFDIVLCGFAVRGLGFPAAFAICRDRAPQTPVVMIAGPVGEEVVADIMRLGAADVVLKDRLAHRLGPIVTREMAQQREQHAAASFRLLFESNPMPVLVFDAETLAFLQVNEAALAKYGWSHETFLSRRLTDILPRHEQSVARFDGIDRYDGQALVPSVHVNAAGERFTVRVAYHGLQFQGRSAVLVVVWDVTEIEQARDQLRTKNAELAELTERLTMRTTDLVDAARLARIGTWSVDFAPRRIVLSPEAYAILGQNPSIFPLDIAHVTGCVHPDDRRAFREAFRRMNQARVDLQTQYRIVRPSGEVRTLRGLSRPKRNAGGRIIGLAGVVQDVTEQMLAADALLRAEKLKTIGQLTGGVAHDFNNLLTVIGLNVEAVIDAEHLPPDLREMLESAAHATQRGAEMTGQLLSYARRQSLRPRVVDLRALPITMQPLLERAVGGLGRLSVETGKGNLSVEIDAGQFENAVMNLVINARDALAGVNAAHASIDVLIEAIGLRRPLRAMPDVIAEGDYVRVRVSDTGSGIPAETLPRIFEPFFTTKDVGSGSGLGLSMVYGFVHQSRGAMSVVSRVGQGTVIDLYFPQSQAVAAPAPVAVAEPAFEVPRRRALLVEDGADLRQTMTQIFRRIGFDTVAVGSADEALTALRAQPPFDLLFSDIVLPGGMSGLGLAEAAQSIDPAPTVVLTSGNTREIDATNLKWPILPKPFRVSALTELLSAILT